MPTYTIFGSTSDGAIQSGLVDGNTYAQARAGQSLVAADTAGSAFLQHGNVNGSGKGTFTYSIKNLYFAFDTSVVPSGDSVTAVDFSLVTASSKGGSTWNAVEAFYYDWGAALTTADWVDGTIVAGLTKVASVTLAAWTVNARNSFVENGSNFKNNIQKGSTTRLFVCFDTFRTGTAPSDSQLVGAVSFTEDTGTTNDPKLIVTTTASANGNMFAMFV